MPSVSTVSGVDEHSGSVVVVEDEVVDDVLVEEVILVVVVDVVVVVVVGLVVLVVEETIVVVVVVVVVVLVVVVVVVVATVTSFMSTFSPNHATHSDTIWKVRLVCWFIPSEYLNEPESYVSCQDTSLDRSILKPIP
jgi:hypothetical protein